MTAVWIHPAHTSNGCALRGSSLVAGWPFKSPWFTSESSRTAVWLGETTSTLHWPRVFLQLSCIWRAPTCYLEPCVPRCNLRVGHAGLESACLLLPRAVRCANPSVFQDGMSLGPLLPCQDFMCKTEFGQVYRRWRSVERNFLRIPVARVFILKI